MKIRKTSIFKKIKQYFWLSPVLIIRGHENYGWETCSSHWCYWKTNELSITNFVTSVNLRSVVRIAFYLNVLQQLADILSSSMKAKRTQKLPNSVTQPRNAGISDQSIYFFGFTIMRCLGHQPMTRQIQNELHTGQAGEVSSDKQGSNLRFIMLCCIVFYASISWKSDFKPGRFIGNLIYYAECYAQQKSIRVGWSAITLNAANENLRRQRRFTRCDWLRKLKHSKQWSNQIRLNALFLLCLKPICTSEAVYIRKIDLIQTIPNFCFQLHSINFCLLLFSKFEYFK